MTATYKTHPSEYFCLAEAKRRCVNLNHPRYADYGGRGIEFRLSLQQLLEEVGPRPSGRYPSGKPHWTLDRRNNDGHYEPGNIRWSTADTQNKNTRPHDVCGQKNPMFGKKRPDLAAWNTTNLKGRRRAA